MTTRGVSRPIEDGWPPFLLIAGQRLRPDLSPRRARGALGRASYRVAGHWAHNAEVEGSSPSLTTSKINYVFSLRHWLSW